MRNLFLVCLVVTITVASAFPHPAVSIMDIQGRGHTSPLAGDTVVTTGVVTVVERSGFYVQDPSGDGDPATSDALFVFTSVAPTVSPGDLVSLEGVVHEYRPGNDPHNLTVTEIDRPTVTTLSPDNPPPDPVQLGRGGRLPPSEVIDNDSLTSFDPDSDGLDFFESVESMRVLVRDAVSVSVTNRHNETWVLGDNGSIATGVHGRGGITISAGDFNPERIQLDGRYLSGTLALVEVGDRLGDVMGVVGYRFGNFEVLPSSMPPVERIENTRETTALRSGASALTVSAFNVANLDRHDEERIGALAEIIVRHLYAPDVMVLEEVQDDSGTKNDGTVDAARNYGAVIAAIKRAGGPDFEFRDIAPEDGEDGGAPGANIRVGILFQPQRVTFVDRGGALARDATDAVATGSGPALYYSPGRVDPLAAAWVDARKPLAAELIFAGQRFFLVACHFSARSGSSPLFGAEQPPVVLRSDKRIAQARLVRHFVDRLLDIDPLARVIVLGDFNDFQFSQTLAALEGALVNLTNHLPAVERYTYNFEGNAQALDHILVSQTLATAARYDIVHISVDFAASVSDHDPVLARLSFPASTPASMPLRPLQACPNPFTTTTNLLCVTGAAGPVEASVYDVTGHRIRTLLLQVSAEGIHEGTWDGLDDRGKRAPAGLYFVRVVDQQQRWTTKLVRMQ